MQGFRSNMRGNDSDLPLSNSDNAVRRYSSNGTCPPVGRGALMLGSCRADGVHKGSGRQMLLLDPCKCRFALMAARAAW